VISALGSGVLSPARWLTLTSESIGGRDLSASQSRARIATVEDREGDPWASPSKRPLPRYPDERQSSDRRRPPPSSSDFTSETMLRPRAESPSRGWRRTVFRATGGRVNPGPSAKELSERELVAQIRQPVSGCRRIAVISRKGGVGKTTTTLALGHTFASLRGDRVIALDGNPDAGSLAYRVPRETANTITNLLVSRNELQRYADVRAFTSQAPTRLEVLAADDDPRITDALREEDYRQVVSLLEVHYNLICMDTGTGVLESAAKGILQLADQLVLVTAPSLDSGRAASSTLDWLEKNGYEQLVASGVAVVNAVRPGKGMVDLEQMERHFRSRCRSVIRIPWDQALDAGAETDLESLRVPTRAAWLQLAAEVAKGFTESETKASHPLVASGRFPPRFSL